MNLKSALQKAHYVFAIASGIFLTIILVNAVDAAVGGITFSSLVSVVTGKTDQNTQVITTVARPTILGSSTDGSTIPPITFNVPARFNQTLNVFKDASISGQLYVEGNLTAPNVIYSLSAGSGINISGGQNPTISTTGLVTGLTAGTGISVGTGANPQIANNDRGSSQNIFKKFAVSGQSDIVAGSNSDTLTLVGGGNITLTTDATNKKLTISGSSSSVPDTGWTKSGTNVYLTSLTDSVGIGTTSPSGKLEIAGATSITSGGLSVIGGIANNAGGITGVGALTGATSLTASGTITFSGLSGAFTGSRVLTTDNTGVLSSITDGSSGQVLTSDGNGMLQWTTVAGAGGVTGAGSSDRIAFWTGASSISSNANLYWDSTNNRLGLGDSSPAASLTVGSGDLFQVSSAGAITAATGISSSGTITLSGLSSGVVKANGSGVLSGGNTIALGSEVTGTLSQSNGGTGFSTYTQGDILYASAANTLSKRGIGTDGQVLVAQSGVPVWSSSVTASSIAFSGITSGTNIQAAMIVGTGASLTVSGSGTINATTLLGSTWAAPGTIGSGTPNTGAFTTLSASGTINGATISGGTLSGGTVSGGTFSGGVVSGGSLTGGTYTGTGLTVAGNYTATINNTGNFSISDGTQNIFTVTDAGTVGNLSNIGTITTSGAINTATISGGTLSGGTVSGGTLSAGTFSGGSVSGGALTGGTYTNTGATVTGGYAFTIGNTGSFTLSDGTNTIFTLADGGTLGDLSSLRNLTASGTITFANISSGIVKANGSGVLSGGNTVNLATEVTGTLAQGNGGTGFSTYTKGDILYASAANTLSKLGIGGTDQVLTADASGVPYWASVTGGGGLCASCVITNPGATQTITPTTGTATGLAVRAASGGNSADIFNVADNAGTTKYLQVSSSGDIVTASTLTVSPASTDPIKISPVAQGVGAFTGTITSVDLTGGAKTWTFPNTTGTICLVEAGNCAGSGTGVTTAGGSTNTIAKFTGAQSLGDSSITDDGTTIGFANDISFSATTPRIAITNTETLSITDGTNTLFSIADSGTSGTATVNTLAATNIGAFTLTGNITGSGTPTLSGLGTINGATLSGGSLSGGSLTGGTYTATGLSVTGNYTATINNTGTFNIYDGTQNIFTVTDAGVVGDLTNIGAITANGAVAANSLNINSNFSVSSGGNITSIGGAAHSISNSSGTLVIDSAGTITIADATTFSGRVSVSHGNSQGLKLPTNAGSPSGVTGTTEGDVVWDATNNALYVYDGAAFSQVGGNAYTGWSISDGSVTESISSGNTLVTADSSTINAAVSATDTLTYNVIANSLDFSHFANSMSLDANLTIAQTTNTWAQTYTGTTGAGFTYTASGALTSGNAAVDINVSNASTSVPALMLTNNGTGVSFRINDDGTTSDSSPFIIDASGNVTIGSTTATGLLNVGTSAQFQVSSVGAITAPTSVNTINSLIINAGALSSVTGFSQGSGAFTLSGSGAVSLGTGTNSITIGNATGTFALASSGGLNVTTGGALTGVASIDTISTSATSLGFAGTGAITSGAGTALSLTSGTTGAVTLDTGTTGTVNLATGNNAKTINIGTGTAGNTVNIGTNNSVADTINIASALDTTTVAGTVSLTGLSSGTGNAICLNGSNNLVTCTVGSGGISGTGTSGQIAFFNGTSTLTSESSGFGWDTANKRFSITSTDTTGSAASFTNASLTTGKLLNIVGTSTATSNTALTQNLFDITNAQATNANTNGITGLGINFTNNPTVAGNTEYAARIQNQVTTNTTDNAVAALLLLDNADTSGTGSTVVTDALRITNSGGITAGITSGINFASTTIDTGINFSSTPTTNYISGTNFSVTAAGAPTFAGAITAPTSSNTINSLVINSGALSSVTGYTQGSGAFTVNGSGAVSVGTGTNSVSIGNATGTFTLASSGGLNVTSGGALTGVASIDTISTSATALGFAGAGSITSTTTSAVTLDSGTTGTVNVGTGNNAKTLNFGTGTAGNIINIGTNNTTADTIGIGSALDTLTVAGTTTFSNRALFNHGNSQGLKLPTNAGAPSGVTGTTEGDIVYDSTNDALYIYNGSAFAQIGGNGYSGWSITDGSVTETIASGNTLTTADSSTINAAVSATDTLTYNVIADSLDYSHFADSMSLDAALTLAQSTNTWSQTYTGTTGTGYTYTASSLTSGTANLITTAATAFTGTLVNITSTGNNASNTGTLWRVGTTGTSDAVTTAMVTNGGTGTTLRINDDGTDSDSSPFLIDASGNVTIGSTTTTGLLNVGSSAQFQVSSAGAITAPTSTNTINNLVINAGALSGITGYSQTSGTFAQSGTGTFTVNGSGTASFGTGTGNVALGNATGTFALTSNGGLNVTTGGALTGVASIDTISTSATALGFAGTGALTSGAGTALNITSGTSGALTLDSGSTGTVNLATGNNAKTLNLGTGTAGNTINIGTNNTVADTINIASALDTTTIAGALNLTGLSSQTGSTLCLTAGNVVGTCASGSAVSGSGASGRMAFWNGASSLSSNSNFVWDDSNARLGIGLSSASYKLDVADSGTASGIRGLNVSQTGAVSGTGYGGYFSKTGASTTNVGLYTEASGASNNYGLIVGAGNVGIGDTSPTALLTVGSGDLFQVDASGRTFGPSGTLGAGTLAYSFTGDTNTGIYNSTADTLDFATGGVRALSLGTTASAVNYLSITPAATGNAPTLTAAGSDSNVGLTLTGKGTGSLTFNTSATTGTTTSSGFVYNANSLTTGTGLNLSSTSLTSGNLAVISSTSTALTSGGLLSLDWSPSSSTTATGDLLALNIGANGTIGNIFNIKNNGTSVFSTSQVANTSANPLNVTAPGDVAIAYDIALTNQTASYIKSNAPLYLEAGESFESNDLTLRTFNSGQVVLDAPGAVNVLGGGSWSDTNGSITHLQIATGSATLSGSASTTYKYERVANIGKVTFNGTNASQTITRATSLYVDTPAAGTNVTITDNRPIDTASGGYLTSGGSWTNSSDRNLKENFTELSRDDVLAKINLLPITQWNYKAENANTMHIGPVAQDFYDIFGLGNNNTSISTVDPAGIALVGIQALSEKVNQLSGQTQSMQSTALAASQGLQLSLTLADVNKLLKDTYFLDPTENTLSIGKQLIAKAGFTSHGDVTFNGAFVAQGKATFNDETLFNKLVTFASDVIYNGNVMFTGTPTFNKDTGGIAIIESNKDSVTVNFEKEYEVPPIVSVTMVHEGEASASGLFKSFYVTDKTTKGFTIKLDMAQIEEVSFNWIAIAIKDPKVTKSSDFLLPSPTPSESTPSATPIESPEAGASGTPADLTEASKSGTNQNDSQSAPTAQ